MVGMSVMVTVAGKEEVEPPVLSVTIQKTCIPFHELLETASVSDRVCPLHFVQKVELRFL